MYGGEKAVEYSMSYERQYCNLLKLALTHGNRSADRTGTGTMSVFAESLKIDVRDGFPMLTLRKLNFRNVIAEALWYLRGEKHIKWLRQQGIKFWDPWAKDEDGNIGPMYGYQWRRFNSDSSLDQIKEAERLLRDQPESRRILVTAWNPAQLNQMALPPCPFAFQLYARNGELSMLVYQRSADLVVGVPHDIAVHALLLHMFAEAAGLEAAELAFSFGDAHIYNNHEDAAREMLVRNPRTLPLLHIVRAGQKSVDDFEMSDFELEGYNPLPLIRVEVAI